MTDVGFRPRCSSSLRARGGAGRGERWLYGTICIYTSSGTDYGRTYPPVEMRRLPPHAEQPTTKQAFVYIPLYFSPAICFDGPFLKHEGFETPKILYDGHSGHFWFFTTAFYCYPPLTNRIYVKQSFPTRPNIEVALCLCTTMTKKLVHVNVLLRKVAVFTQKYSVSSVKKSDVKTRTSVRIGF